MKMTIQIIALAAIKSEVGVSNIPLTEGAHQL